MWTRPNEGHHYFVVMRGTFHTSCSVHSTTDDRAAIEQLVNNRFVQELEKQDIFHTITSTEITEEH